MDISVIYCAAVRRIQTISIHVIAALWSNGFIIIIGLKIKRNIVLVRSHCMKIKRKSAISIITFKITLLLPSQMAICTECARPILSHPAAITNIYLVERQPPLAGSWRCWVVRAFDVRADCVVTLPDKNHKISPTWLFCKHLIENYSTWRRPSDRYTDKPKKFCYADRKFCHPSHFQPVGCGIQNAKPIKCLVFMNIERTCHALKPIKQIYPP